MGVKRGASRLRREVGKVPREISIAVIAAAAAAPLAAWLVDDRIRVWVAVVIAVTAFCLGVVRGGSHERSAEGGDARAQLEDLEQQVGRLSQYDTYTVHVRDALADLRRVLDGELPSFSLKDFVETGIFEPAHLLLQRDYAGGERGHVRFSILHPSDDGQHFVMSHEGVLFPAHGHRAESREHFRLEIKGSFAGFALHTGKVQSSNRLSADERYEKHPHADPERGYESIVSVPLWSAGAVDGVLNVIATREDAFSAVDRTYITLLASVIDVARAVANAIRRDRQTEQEEGADHERTDTPNHE